MSRERLGPEPDKNREFEEVRFDIAYRPFKGVRDFFHAPKGQKVPWITEDYEYGLALRKGISLDGLNGFIDVITDEPTSWMQSLVGKNCKPVEKPLGETNFESVYRGNGQEEFTEEPCILRFAFLMYNPGQYAKLLETFTDVELGKEKYILVWNQNRPLVKRCMRYLEEGGKELYIVEKNLFNYKEIEEAEEDLDGPLTKEEIEEFEKMDVGRVTFVWLPLDLAKLRTIKVTFRRLNNGGDMDQPEVPNDPAKEPLPVVV
ncbi:hypothetical protein HYW43_00760 [Candidatus Daviesbacteria bacterium]|nr:hypothetical protein [Candidatus Daviesbacteria bacterium]